MSVFGSSFSDLQRSVAQGGAAVQNDCCYADALGGSQSAPNPISIPNASAAGTGNTQVCQKNANRKEIILVNVGTVTIFISLGQPATSQNYSFALSPCAIANDGTGGLWISDIWQGEIHAITANGAGSAGLLNVTEEV